MKKIYLWLFSISFLLLLKIYSIEEIGNYFQKIVKTLNDSLKINDIYNKYFLENPELKTKKIVINLTKDKTENENVVDGVVKIRENNHKRYYWINLNRKLKDEIQDRNFYEKIPSFIDLNDLKINIRKNSIKIKIGLLKYIKPSSIEARKYQVEFYLDKNEKLEIGLTNQIFDSGDKIEYLYINYESEKEEDYKEYNIDKYIKYTKNSITFNIPKSLHTKLKKITPYTKVHFWTWYNNENLDKSFYDNYPN